MAMGWEDLKAHVGADYEDDAALMRLWTVAASLVDNWLGTIVVPVGIRDEAVLLVGAELFDRAKTPSVNAGQFEQAVTPMRVTRDPMNAAYKLLRTWVRPF